MKKLGQYILGIGQSVVATVIAAAIVANLAFVFRVNERLARLETKIELLTIGRIAQK